MAPNSAASRLAKMMQSYRNGGYVYAQGSDEVADDNPYNNPNREEAGFVYDIVGSMMRDQPWYKTPLEYRSNLLDQYEKEGRSPEEAMRDDDFAFINFKDAAIQEALALQKIDPKSEKGKLIAQSVANELERDYMRHFQEVAPEEAKKGFGGGAFPEYYANYFSDRLGYKVDDPAQSLMLTPDMEQKFWMGKPDTQAGPGGWVQKIDPESRKPMYRPRTAADPFEAALGYSQRGFTYMPESERTRPEFEPIEMLQQRGPSRIPGGINQPGGMLEAALRNRGLMR